VTLADRASLLCLFVCQSGSQRGMHSGRDRCQGRSTSPWGAHHDRALHQHHQAPGGSRVVDGVLDAPREGVESSQRCAQRTDPGPDATSHQQVVLRMEAWAATRLPLADSPPGGTGAGRNRAVRPALSSVDTRCCSRKTSGTDGGVDEHQPRSPHHDQAHCTAQVPFGEAKASDDQGHMPCGA